MSAMSQERSFVLTRIHRFWLFCLTRAVGLRSVTQANQAMRARLFPACFAANSACNRRTLADQAASRLCSRGCRAMDTPLAASGLPTRSFSRSKAVRLLQRMRRSFGSHLAWSR